MRLSDKWVEEDTRFGHTCSGEEEITKYNAIMNSNISILRLWISIFSRETVIIPRAYNVYYSECGFHSAIGTPVCIREQDKTYMCYGCKNGGTIIHLLVDCYCISYAEAINVLYAFVTKAFESLTPREREVYRDAFKNYDAKEADIYFGLSLEKSMNLKERVDDYFGRYGDSDETRKNAMKRLCISRRHLPPKKELPKDSNTYDELPF